MKKVVPVVLRDYRKSLEILVFRHPLAGVQLVKGTIEQDEHPQQAAIRELFEESGLITDAQPDFMGKHILKFNQQVWYFYLCRVGTEIENIWTHHCMDDGGLDFEFFWYPVNQPPQDDWHDIFQDAFSFIQQYLATTTNVRAIN